MSRPLTALLSPPAAAKLNHMYASTWSRGTPRVSMLWVRPILAFLRLLSPTFFFKRMEEIVPALIR